MALGANAVCVGRPIVRGLGAFGQAGVEKVLDIFHTELIRNMQLIGAASIADLNRDFVICDF